MRTRPMLALTVALALGGLSVLPAASASVLHRDPIAHMAVHAPSPLRIAGRGDPATPAGSASRHHHGSHYVNPLAGGQRGHAYGRLCAKESRKHVAGQAGTPFSACVKALRRLARQSHESAAKACRLESKRHTAGQPGTPFSRCVAAGHKLRRHG